MECIPVCLCRDMVRLGEYDLTRSDDVPDTQDFGIVQRHSIGYNPRTYENDIVILVLDRNVVFSGKGVVVLLYTMSSCSHLN